MQAAHRGRQHTLGEERYDAVTTIDTPAIITAVARAMPETMCVDACISSGLHLSVWSIAGARTIRVTPSDAEIMETEHYSISHIPN
jgi:ABC-type phosphate transport system permease subunit